MPNIDDTVLVDIRDRAKKYFTPGRKAFSLRFPACAPLILGVRRIFNFLRLQVNFRVTTRQEKVYLEHKIYEHSSLLRRKLGSSNPELQERKIVNLKRAIADLDGLVIKPGETFSLWKSLGQIDEIKGYVRGMLLAQGKVVEGVGGGLCQLSNVLYWMFLHCPVEIMERHHHSFDPFPDSDRTIPFGSGATVAYNFVDLKVKNISDQPLQLKLWLTDRDLRGKIVSTATFKEKYHVYEKYPHFIIARDSKFRYNQIWRDTLVEGKVVKSEHITTNFAPVLYELANQESVVLIDF